MEFPKEYFEDEVREGFYVNSLMKRAWAAQLEVYEDIAKVCKMCGIEFFADWGTMLGAVRHKGFIPWDDDMDICIMYEDTERFLQAMREHLPSNYEIMTHKTPNYGEWFIRILNSNSINTKTEFLERYHDFPFAAGVDVFMMFPLVDNQEEISVVNSLRDIASNITRRIVGDIEATDEEIEKYIVMFEEMVGIPISRESKVATKSSILDIMIKLYSMYDKSETPYVTIPLNKGYGKMFIERKAYENPSEMTYENITVRVPGDYDHILSAQFGDYMRLVRHASHDYPFFKKQKTFYERVNKKVLDYHIDAETIQGLRTREQSDRKKVLFLPWKASGWKYMENIWRECADDPECDVRVIPIPYYYREKFDHLTDVQYEAELLPDYVTITGLDEFDMETYDADVIYFQCPFDGINYGVSVHPYFYSTNLRKFCKELVYVQFYEIDDIESKDDTLYCVLCDMVAMPGVVYADRTYLQSENMREYSIEYLTEWAGEETREIWEEKLQVRNG